MKQRVRTPITLMMFCLVSPYAVFADASSLRAELPFCDEPGQSPSSSEYSCQARNIYRAVSDSNRDREIPFSEKKGISTRAYEQWNRILTPVLSNDGRWVVYVLEAATGLSELVVRTTQGQREFRVARAREIRITDDSQFVLFSVVSPEDQKQFGALEGGLPSVLGILRLSDGMVTWITAGNFSFKLLNSTQHHIAYIVEQQAAKIPASGRVTPGKSRTLVLRNLVSGAEVDIADATEFAFDNEGRFLAYTVESYAPEHNGVYVRRLADGRVFPLVSGSGTYRRLRFDRSGRQLVFLSDRDIHDRPNQRYALYYAASPLEEAVVAVPPTAFGSDWMISPDADVEFTRRDNAVSFGVVPVIEKPAPYEGSSAASFDLWHWREPVPLPQGRHNNDMAGSPRWQLPRSYLAVYHVAEKKWVQLGSESTPNVLLTGNARFAVGLNPYRLESSWDNWSADVYLMDAHSGRRHLFRHQMQPGMHAGPNACIFTQGIHCRYFALSPQGKYAVYFDDRRWRSVELATKKVVDMTGSLLPDVYFDIAGGGGGNTPASKSQNLATMVSPIAGWTNGDRRVLLYSQYDIWEIDPAGVSAPRNLTAGQGERQKVVFRLLEDFDLALSTLSGASKFLPRFGSVLDSSVPMLLIGVDQGTMASGVWRLPAGAPPEQLLWLRKRVTPVARARNALQYLMTIQTFSEYPDLWTGSRFDKLTKISEANPQQRNYRWGSTELVEFTSDWGVQLKGILYKPENFDPAKKYPMIVSMYKSYTSSYAYHRYVNPAPQSGAPVGVQAWPSIVSQGYLYFVPDVPMAAPYIGPSALAAVVPAVQSLIDQGFIDVKRICLTGHSFGGYETNYIITQSNLFRCAISGAGPANLLSWHGTEPLGSQVLERGQGLGGSIWERPFVYITNSPVFYANKVQTPVLMMHNDGDQHPPMSQSIEFFNALRRNGKEAYLFNYRGEGHGLAAYVNQLDWDHRVTAWLDYWLKDGPKPIWMDDAKRVPMLKTVNQREGQPISQE